MFRPESRNIDNTNRRVGHYSIVLDYTNNTSLVLGAGCNSQCWTTIKEDPSIMPGVHAGCIYINKTIVFKTLKKN